LVLVGSLLSGSVSGRAGSGQSEPTPSQVVVGELPDRSTAASTTRRNEDGSYTTTVYSGPVNYRAADGSMRRIDPGLYPVKQGGYDWRSGANSFQARFSDTAGSGFAEVGIGDRTVRLTAVGAAAGEAVVEGSRISYPRAYRSADLRYTVTPSGIKEVIELTGPDAPASFTFRLVADDGGPAPSVQRRGDGSYAVVLPPLPAPAFVLEAPVVQESAGEREVAPPAERAKPQLQVDSSGRDLVVRLRIDRDWLRAPGRRFPVYVDPSMTIQPDSEDASFVAAGNFLPFVNERLFIGSGSSNHWRAALLFDLAGLPVDAQVTDANLGLYFDGWCIATSGPFCGGTEHVLDAHRMTGAWSLSSTSDQLSFEAAALSSHTLAASLPRGWMNWPVTGTVQGWVSGSLPNYGLLVKRRAEVIDSSGPVPPGRRFTGSPDLQPRLEVTYISDAVDLLEPATLHGNGADLAWTRYTGPSGAPFTRYEVHRAAGSATFTPGPSTLLATITQQGVTTYRDTTAAPEATFTYRVVANESASNPRTVTLPPPGQASKVLQPDPAAGRNTYLYFASGITNCANYGAETGAWVGTTASAKWRNALYFDLRDIPADATITQATASVWQSSGPSTPLTVQAHRITRPWKEGTGKTQCTGDGATWYETEAGRPWTTQGGDIDSTVVDQVSVAAGASDAFHDFTITDLVQDWVAGTAPNNGVLLRAGDETLREGNWLVYATDDYTASPTLRPKLSVVYADGSVARGPRVSLSAPGPDATVRGASVRLAAAAEDDRRVDLVEFLVDGAVVGSDTAAPFETVWDSTSVQNGVRSITVRASDDAGNLTTSEAVAVTVDNSDPPTGSLSAPAAGSTVAGSLVTLSATASDDLGVTQVEFLVDGLRVGAPDTTGPYSIAWDTLDPLARIFNGSHQLAAVVTDTSGQRFTTASRTVSVDNLGSSPNAAGFTLNDPASSDDDVFPQVMAGNTNPGVPVQDPYAGTVRPDGTSGGSLDRALGDAPQDDGGTPPPSCPAGAYCPTITVTNNSGITWQDSTAQVWYRWYAPNGAIMFEGRSEAAFPSTFRKNKSATFPLTIYPPALPPGATQGAYRLRVDVWDPATSGWFAANGNPPLDNPIIVAKILGTKLGLERYYQYDAEAAGAGMSTLTNVANGDMLLRWTPLFSPGRGLSTMVDLTYNSLEDHSTSPVGNNFALSVSGLTRFGQPLDIHPNKADQISGQADKWVEFSDGDGTRHRFTGTTGADGVTRWAEPPGVNLYLRSLPEGDPNGRWALTRPDKVTFYFDADGFPLSVRDRNDNRITFTLQDTPPGQDPGGPKKRIVEVTDAAGRSFAIDYWSKDEAKKAHVRGNIQTITDHSGSALDFDYYDDGNLLRLTQRGGTNADGTFLPDRSFVFTYTTSSGAAPAISDPALRADPPPRTANQSTRLFSVRDPRGNETTFAYHLATDGPQLRWKLKSRTNRDGQTTSYGYDLTNQATTVAAPLSRTTTYTYDTSGKVVSIVNPNDETTGVQWSADFKVTKLTEPTGVFSTWTYNDNGYLTSHTNQAGQRSELTYLDQPVDADDTGEHLSLLATVTTPKGVATTTPGDDFQTTFTYDPAGNPDQVTDPTGAVTDYDYHLAGSADPGTLAAVHDANGNPPTLFEAYHPSGQPTRIKDPAGHTTTIGYNADGQVRWIQDPNHQTDTGSDERAYKTFFDYDSFGRLGRQSAPKSTSVERGTLLWSSVEFDPNDNLTRAIDAHYGPASGDPQTGAVTTTSYDLMDRPVLVTGADTSADPAGERTSMEYDAAGRTVKLTRPRGVASATVDDFTTVFGYDPLDRLITQTRYGTDTSTGQTRLTQMCYDLAGDLRSVTTPRAGTTITCPGDGPAEATHTRQIDYDAAHRPTAQRDALGNETRTTYDANGNPHTREQDITATRVARTVLAHNQRDQLVEVRQRFDAATGRDVVTQIEYDPNGNRSKVISPRAFDAAGGAEPSQYVSVHHYDPLNRLTRVDLPFDAADGAERQYVHHSYDPNGNLAWTSLPVTVGDPAAVGAGAKTLMEYFDPGWIRTSDDPTNPKVHFDYTAQGWQAQRQAELADQAGTLDPDQRQSWTYHLDGWLKTRTDRQGQISRYEYDPHNNLVEAFDTGLSDPGEKEVLTQARYTGFDETGKVRHRKAGQTEWTFTGYVYDANGNVTLRQENGKETGEDINGPTTQTGPARRIELSYDNADWLSVQLDLGTDPGCENDSRTINSWWDTGWEKQRDIYRAGQGCTSDPGTWPNKQTTTWTHFDNGKLRELETRNGAGTITESRQVGYHDSNDHYLNGNRTTDRYILQRENVTGTNTATTCTPANPCQAEYDYDARERLIGHQQRAGRQITYTLDQPAHLLGDATIRAGNITTETSPTQTTTRRYTANQLTDATIGAATAKYWYDTAGNLDCVTTAGGDQTNCSPPAGAAAANLIADYTYDHLNRLVTAGMYNGSTRTDHTRYTYDALDRTTEETENHAGTSNDRTTQFTYQGITPLVTEEQQTGGTNPRTKTFSYDAYGHRIAMSDKPTGSTDQADHYTYASDVHGSISQLIDTAGNVKASYGYTPYGGADAPATDNETLTTGDTNNQAPLNPYRYTGKRLDSGTTPSNPPAGPAGAAGYDMGARRYGPDINSFLQQDQFHGALANLGLALDPLTQNRYALAGGNPISYIETDGHQALIDGGGGGSTSPTPPATDTSAEVRDIYFSSSAPSGSVRATYQTGAKTQEQGTITFRLFIQDCRILAVGHGDCRDFSDDPTASSRAVIAWDTSTGEVSFSAYKSCVDLYCEDAQPIGQGNDLTIREASSGSANSAKLRFEYRATNSIADFGAITGEAVIEIRPHGNVYTQIDGAGYPSLEIHQYRLNRPARNLGQDEQSFSHKDNWFFGQIGPLGGLNSGTDRRIAFYNGEPTFNPNATYLEPGPLW
jgi:RHS repeat-associated protein